MSAVRGNTAQESGTSLKVEESKIASQHEKLKRQVSSVERHNESSDRFFYRNNTLPKLLVRVQKQADAYRANSYSHSLLIWESAVRAALRYLECDFRFNKDKSLSRHSDLPLKQELNASLQKINLLKPAYNLLGDSVSLPISASVAESIEAVKTDELINILEDDDSDEHEIDAVPSPKEDFSKAAIQKEMQPIFDVSVLSVNSAPTVNTPLIPRKKTGFCAGFFAYCCPCSSKPSEPKVEDAPVLQRMS